MNKRGQSQYLSWILILAIIVAISVFLYRWSIEQAGKVGEDIEKRTDPLVCAEIGFSVHGICQTFRTIEMNITNTEQLKITGFLIRTVGLYPEESEYLHTISFSHEISPGDSEKLSILKKGTLSQVKIIPITKKKNKDIYCEDQSVIKEQSELVQC